MPHHRPYVWKGQSLRDRVAWLGFLAFWGLVLGAILAQCAGVFR